jgi:hypothetical protein
LVGSNLLIGNASANFVVTADLIRPGYDGWGSIGNTSFYWNFGYFNTLVAKTRFTRFQVFNRQAASYTLVLDDQGKVVEMNSGSANNLTIPLNSSVAFPTGTEITIIQYGAGRTTIVPTGGVNLRSVNSWTKANGQYSVMGLLKVATDEWYLYGDISA